MWVLPAYVFYFNFIRVLKILVSGFNDVLFYVKIARFVCNLS